MVWSVQAGNNIIADPSDPFLVYSGPPATGNLFLSIASVAGTDPYGNVYPAGLSLASIAPANAGGFESLQFGIYSPPNIEPYIDSIINPLIEFYLELVGPDTNPGTGSRPFIRLLQDLVGAVDGIQLTTHAGDIKLQSARAIQLTGATAIPTGSTLQVGPFMNAIKNLQFGSFSSTFSAVNSTSGTLTFPQIFPIGSTPNINGTVIAGSNLDILLNWTGAASNSSIAWRLFQKGGVAVTGTVVVDWWGVA